LFPTKGTAAWPNACVCSFVAWYTKTKQTVYTVVKNKQKHWLVIQQAKNYANLSYFYKLMYVSQLMPLPLTVSCSSKIQIGFTFLVLAYPGCPGKEAVKWL